METLAKLFGSIAKVKLMRLFLFNADEALDMESITRKSKLQNHTARRELQQLETIGLIKKKTATVLKETVRKRKGAQPKKKIPVWQLDTSFPYLTSLQNMLVNTSPLQHGEIMQKLSRVGKLKAVVAAGVFVQDFDGRIDLMVVGDKLSNSTLEAVMKSMEADVGRELRYAAFDTDDFQYRVSVCDKLIRDVLDYHHQVILDKIGVQVPA